MRNEGQSAGAQVLDLALGDTSMAASQGSTIGGAAVEEPLFLDEPADYGGAVQKHTAPSPFELFANEDDKPLWGTFPELGPRPAETTAASLAQRPASAAVPRWRSLLSKCLLVAALSVLAGIGACQALGLTPLEVWQLSSRTLAGR